MYCLFGVLFYIFDIDNYLDYFVINLIFSYIESIYFIELYGLILDF